MNARVWEETIEIPTYEVGEPDKNPLFLENRVYQGSTGKIYPYPVIDKIYDEKVIKKYKAVILENEYLKITFLPQIGGRIYRAVDKTNNHDFVYYNSVIKPALVGLLGPWVSGGIEFNWPQHHRPTTFMPVDYRINRHEDGSASITMGETDRMYGTKSTARFVLYPDRAYLEINVKLYNPTPFPQTFLWWANPALAAGDDTRAIFPPDVTAVYDHGKRDVSDFPVATGRYYKIDYSKGVDISKYKNIPVPTSYMACASSYDFVGGYDDGNGCGMLHIADHHLSPGKKQWTWGCGDFGKAWERNLTDESGPYTELMTGVYTDNQPDFTWLKPFEEKAFTQYFMPYKEIGTVKNATREILISFDYTDGAFHAGIYVTSPQPELHICFRDGEKTVHDETVFNCTPQKARFIKWPYPDKPARLTVKNSRGEILVSCKHECADAPDKTPEPLKAPELPQNVESTEELYYIGLHLEQYRHPTYRPDDYYAEGLRRDKFDSRINMAYGRLILRRGEYEEGEGYLRKALKRITRLDNTPFDAEVFYLLGLARFYNGDFGEAYNLFRKGAWDRSQAGACFYYAAAAKSNLGEYTAALELLEDAQRFHPGDTRFLGLKAALLRLLGDHEGQKECLKQILITDPFNAQARQELFLETGDKKYRLNLVFEYLDAAAGYMEYGMYGAAAGLLDNFPTSPLALYYLGYCKKKTGDLAGAKACYKNAEDTDSSYCFPNSITDRIVLEDHLSNSPFSPMANYYLGILLYDKMLYAKSRDCFLKTTEHRPDFATAHRNLALYYYNKEHDLHTAMREMETAFRLNTKDARVFMELDQLRKKCNLPPQTRASFLEAHFDRVVERDDLYIEYVTILNLSGSWTRALSLIENRKFHPWEGGEGKIPAQYVFSLFKLASSLVNDDPEKALLLLERARTFPDNLGEGKLTSANDTNIDYLCGIAYKNLGDPGRSKLFLEKAAAGEHGMGEALYYNDQPADLLFFKGLALRELGKSDQAEICFDSLINYGKGHIHDHVTIDFFAVSLPDFLTFDDDLDLKNKIHCLYLCALGCLGKGKEDRGAELLRELHSLDCCHIGSAMYGSFMRDCLQKR